MKHQILMLYAWACVFGACSNSEKKTTEPTITQQAPAATEEIMPLGLSLIKKSDCFICHTIPDKKIGPAYVDVAAKYEATDANIDSLANKIMQGGKGVWGDTPMAAHPTISKDDAKEMVKYILSLKPN